MLLLGIAFLIVGFGFKVAAVPFTHGRRMSTRAAPTSCDGTGWRSA
jgi:hypothetical protein